MLVLERKIGQSVYLDIPPSKTPTRVKIILDEAWSDAAKLLFDAPRYVQITRPDAKRGATPGVEK